MRHSLLGMMLGVLLLSSGTFSAQETASVGVQLELSQKFFYAGDPLWVRITVRNGSDGEVADPLKSGLLRGFKVETLENGAAKAAKAASKPGIADPVRPARLSPRSFYGAVIDLARLYPGVAQPGTYRFHWASGKLRSNQLTVRVIPKYDPAKQYVAAMDTSDGQIELRFFPESAPIAVKAFVDLSQAGFYEGLLFQEAQPDTYVAGGNPAFGTQRERHPFTYPAEQNRMPLVSGTVVMKPVGASPPSNGPEFVILLKPQPAWAGQVTVVGQVVKGFDVVQKISRKPTTGQNGRPFFKPLQDVTIRRVTISEVPGTAPQGP